MFKRTFLVVFFLLSVNSVSAFEDVVNKIKSGFQFAGKLLGLDEVTKVAKLVADNFHKAARNNQDDRGNAIFSGFFRILGLNTKKISAIAVNAIIFVAQLISTSLSKAPPSELTSARNLNGTPLEWIMSNSEVSGLLEHAKNKSLPNKIVDYIKERSLDEDTDCIQLLICKTSPFVWGMQKAVDENNGEKGKGFLFAHLPTTDDVADNGDICEKRHPYCMIHY